MPRRSERPLRKVCIRVWDDDYSVLEEIAHSQDVEINRLIRQMIHSYVLQTGALARRNLDRLPPPALDPGFVDSLAADAQADTISADSAAIDL